MKFSVALLRNTGLGTGLLNEKEPGIVPESTMVQVKRYDTGSKTWLSYQKKFKDLDPAETAAKVMEFLNDPQNKVIAFSLDRIDLRKPHSSLTPGPEEVINQWIASGLVDPFKLKLMTSTPKEPNMLELWSHMVISDANIDPVKNLAYKIAVNKEQYQAVSDVAAAAIPNGSKCPWYVIGLIHLMECSLSFAKHLHNGDPLTARTVRVPAGRPKKGNPPFTWHQSAVDAIRMLDFNNAEYDWSYIPFILQKLEEYNGLGYRSKGIYSPYLWAGTNHYTKGKYVADGKWDPNAVSQQIGVAPILSRLLIM